MMVSKNVQKLNSSAYKFIVSCNELPDDAEDDEQYRNFADIFGD